LIGPAGQRRGIAVAVAVACAAAATPARAAAPDKAACAEAYEQAQRLRKAQSFVAARRELLICSRAECAAWVRHDCVPWLASVTAAIPSVVFVVRDADAGPGGAARSDVRVTVDGNLVATRLSEDPIPLDPGDHVVVLEAAGAERVEQRLRLREGEHERRVEIALTSRVTKPAKPIAIEGPVSPLGTPSEGGERPVGERQVPPLVYVLAPTGVAMLALGGYFQVTSMDQRSDLHECAGRCAQDDVDEARRNMWTGNILLTASAITLFAAAYLYFTAERGPGTRVAPRRIPGGIAGSFEASF